MIIDIHMNFLSDIMILPFELLGFLYNNNLVYLLCLETFYCTELKLCHDRCVAEILNH